jgi:hypothetical protein
MIHGDMKSRIVRFLRTSRRRRGRGRPAAAVTLVCVVAVAEMAASV